MNKPEYNTVWIQSTRPEGFDVPDHDLHYTRQAAGLPSVKTHITNQCFKPWRALTIDYNERIFTCDCDGHLPWSVGTVNDFDSFEQIFSSKQALINQQSVMNKTFEFCATQYCGIELTSYPDYKNYISIGLGIDVSCNIRCPSCRERMIFINDPVLLDLKIKAAERIASWIQKTNKIVEITFAGGDAFASAVYMKIINMLKALTNVRFVIKTNGLLIKSRAPEMADIWNRTSFSVSIDAASKAVYEKVRLGGKWETLLENLEYLKSNKLPTSSSFVIQRENIDDIFDFVALCRNYNMIPFFAVVSDWGTWTDYESHCVHLPTSPDYDKFCKIFRDPFWEQNNIKVKQVQMWLPK